MHNDTRILSWSRMDGIHLVDGIGISVFDRRRLSYWFKTSFMSRREKKTFASVHNTTYITFDRMLWLGGMSETDTVRRHTYSTNVFLLCILTCFDTIAYRMSRSHSKYDNSHTQCLRFFEVNRPFVRIELFELFFVIFLNYNYLIFLLFFNDLFIIFGRFRETNFRIEYFITNIRFFFLGNSAPNIGEP